jgi:hypothetical protein
VATEEEARATRYSDVCGTIDELKRILWEERSTVGAGDPSAEELVRDISFMLDRMDGRAREYASFREALRGLLASMDALAPSPRAEARPREAEVLGSLGRGVASDGAAEGLCGRLEEIRDVANRMERLLRASRTLAARVSGAYRDVRGARSWAVDEEGAARELPVPAEYEAWLPPRPHREVVLDWISRGRLHLRSGEIPLIEFEDGGTMPLSDVRWSDEVQNFHRKDEKPNARAYRRYRG